MSLDRGSMSFRVFKFRPGTTLPEDTVAKMAKEAIPPIEFIPADGCFGWATSRHLLDRNITEDTAVIGGHLRVTLVKGEKKIPASLFKTECRQEELASMAAQGKNFLKKAERKEIAKAVKERLLPKMPPTLTGIEVAGTKDGVYSTAVSDPQVDNLLVNWNKVTGQDLIPYTPQAAALMLANLDIRMLKPTSFSSDVKDADVEQDIGTEFLTWLWFFSESLGGRLGEYAYGFDGPFTLIHEGQGAHEVTVKRGNPLMSSEVKSALLASKKLRKAKLTVARGDQTWSCSIDGITWAFGGLKTPKGERLDPVSALQERMHSIGTFIGAIEAVYKKFLDVRVDEKQWAEEVRCIKGWVDSRVGKA